MVLLEAANEPGGFGRTITHGPFRYDAGAHRFHDKDAEITRDVRDLMGDELLSVHAPSQIYWQGRFLDFPLSPGNLARRMGPVNLTKASIDFAAARLGRSAKPTESFAERAYRRYGKTIADSFLIGYSEKLWGVPAEQLTPAVSGGRLKGLSARTMLYELLFGKRGKTRHLDGSFYYPRTGYGRIAARLAEEIGAGNIRLNCRITKLRHDGHKLSAIEINGSEILKPERVISTLAPAQMLSLLNPSPPEEVLNAAQQLKFRDLILVALFLKRPRVTANASMYFPSRDIPFTRLYEPKNRSWAMAPADQTCVVVEIPCFATDDVWRQDDKSLNELVTRHLVEMKLIEAKDVFDARVHHLQAAYPVLELGTESVVENLLENMARFENLYLCGRAARFEYTHVHDLLRQGKELARVLVGTEDTIALS